MVSLRVLKENGMRPLTAFRTAFGLLSIPALAGCLWATAASAAECTFPIQTDTYLDSQSAATNFGPASSVKVLINSSDGSVCRGLFQLPPDVASCDPNRIAKALVCFYVFNNLTAGRNITLYPLTRPFAEGTGHSDGATWNTCDGTNAWTSAGGDFDAGHPVVGVRGADGFFRWDITALLTNTARTNLLACGALLQIDEVPPPSSGTPRAPFTSSEGAAGQTPYVEVTMAAHVSIPIATDTFLDSRNSNTGKNYGAATAVKTVVNSSDGSVCRGLFQLPPEISLYSTDQLARATVVFYVWQDNTTNRNVTLFPLTHSFVEGTGNGAANADGATWSTCDGTNAWTNAGGDFDTNYPVVGVKGDILDTNMNDRFFSWDLSALLTNSQARQELLNYGALLQIDELPTPSSGMPRAPFTSSDDLSYADGYRPHFQLLVIPRTVDVTCASSADRTVQLIVTNCTPFITNRVERNLDLQQADGWMVVTSLVATGCATNWVEPAQSEWTNAFYRVISDQ